MIYILICVSIVLAFAQLVIIYREQTHTTKKHFTTKYSQHIVDIGDKMMRDTKNGIVKKQLLENNAPVYDSGDTLKHYKNSLKNSSIQQRVFSLGEKRYYG